LFSGYCIVIFVVAVYGHVCFAVDGLAGDIHKEALPELGFEIDLTGNGTEPS